MVDGLVTRIITLAVKAGRWTLTGPVLAEEERPIFFIVPAISHPPIPRLHLIYNLHPSHLIATLLVKDDNYN